MCNFRTLCGHGNASGGVSCTGQLLVNATGLWLMAVCILLGHGTLSNLCSLMQPPHEHSCAKERWLVVAISQVQVMPGLPGGPGPFQAGIRL